MAKPGVTWPRHRRRYASQDGVGPVLFGSSLHDAPSTHALAAPGATGDCLRAAAPLRRLRYDGRDNGNAPEPRCTYAGCSSSNQRKKAPVFDGHTVTPGQSRSIRLPSPWTYTRLCSVGLVVFGDDQHTSGFAPLVSGAVTPGRSRRRWTIQTAQFCSASGCQGQAGELVDLLGL
ncbi:hypothetical protein HPB48_009416 [Haemaphysalis longicornis]|uniref:Uncharacterized protein n=1 Tax=Haemaphysalis longicornis TaxID=44386 RepID=A0A9J6GLY4_HAELO|nr:hypothetical protein HPB48_009416 [Haemaphysalis longicornis]